MQLTVEGDDTPREDETCVFLGIRWWGSNSEYTSSSCIQQTDHMIEASIPCVIRTSRSKFVDWLRDAPRRQALEVVYRIENEHGKSRELCGYVPLASLIERLTAVELSTVSCRDIRVGLRERSAVAESPLGSPHMYIRCNIDVSFDSGDRIASLSVSEQGAVDRLAELSISKGKSPVVLGGDSLDELGGDPGWPSHARQLHVYVVSVRFDQSYASLHMGDDARVYLTLGTCKDGSDQKVTSRIPFHESGIPGSKTLEASWNEDEVVSFDPRMSCENSPKAVDRVSTDSHTSAQSESLCHSRKMSQSPVSPILRVSLWKSVKILDQFHTFSKSGDTNKDGISPYDGLIGSAVIATTGALSQEEGVEIPLYTSDLKKSGTVHLKIVTNAAENVSVDDASALNYELLSSMDALARHVAPAHPAHEHGTDKKVRYAMSDSDDSACVGIAYEGAVSCSDDEGVHVVEPPKAEKVPGILSDDWVFNIEKSAC